MFLFHIFIMVAGLFLLIGMCSLLIKSIILEKKHIFSWFILSIAVSILILAIWEVSSQLL